MDSLSAVFEKHRDPLLLFGLDQPLDGLRPALEASGIELQALQDLSLPSGLERSTVLLADAALARQTGEIRKLPEHVVVVAADQEADALLGDAALFTLAGCESAAQMRVLRAAFELSSARMLAAREAVELARSYAEIHELNRIGLSLMMERNPDRLLWSILDRARQLTSSDVGALFLVETNAAGQEFLRFKIVESDSFPDRPAMRQEVAPIDHNSLAGHAALTRRPVVLDDAHQLPADAPYRLNEKFDRLIGYYRKSIVTIPMVDQMDRVVGVLQLSNRKESPDARIRSKEDAETCVLPYSRSDVELAFSLAGQAAVSIENSKLYQQLEHMLDCFVKAAVTAIDERDPSTAGHSVRVATLTLELARALERSGAGSFRGLHWSWDQLRELRFAAMLHDFGKVAVREDVLVKARKLPPVLWERVSARFDLMRAMLQVEYYRRCAQLMVDGVERGRRIAKLRTEYEQQLAEVERFQSAVRMANEPAVLAQDVDSVILDFAERTFTLPDGREVPCLDDTERRYLEIPKGSLDDRERREVESHVAATFRFLEQIPWTAGLHDVAHYAYGHHEKLDGSGYPRGISSRAIPLQTRILTVSDIFDALTEADRPYKKAVPVGTALDILRQEATAGLIDSEIVNVLCESQVYREVTEKNWRDL